MSETHGTVSWNELNSNDIQKSLDYYTKLMGWTVQTVDMGMGDYHIFMKGDQMIGGASAIMPEMGEVPDHWLTYLNVDDVDASVAETVAMGGKIINGPFDVPETGRMCILHDPTGAVVGLMTPEG